MGHPNPTFVLHLSLVGFVPVGWVLRPRLPTSLQSVLHFSSPRYPHSRLNGLSSRATVFSTTVRDQSFLFSLAVYKSRVRLKIQYDRIVFVDSLRPLDSTGRDKDLFDFGDSL